MWPTTWTWLSSAYVPAAAKRTLVELVAGVLRFRHSHGKHFEARCSAASRSRSLPSQRSR